MESAAPNGHGQVTNLKRMNRLLLLCIAGISLVQTANSQIGGRTTYNFLNLTPSARMTALGGSLINVVDEDPANAVYNPGLLNESMHGGITFQNNFHFDGIYNGYVGYAHYVDKWGITTHGGVQFMQYGKFQRADQFGNRTGEFKASEQAFTVGASKEFAKGLSAGMNLRLINSNLESFNSFGMAFDIGAAYNNPERRMSAGITFRNVGFQISAYDEIRETVPLDIQIGFAKRLKHLPFRFSVIAHTLNRWNLRYDSPLDEEETILVGQDDQGPSSFSMGMDNFFRHFIFSGEFLIGKTEAVKLRLAYNHQRRKELTIGSLRSLAGFSAGVGIKIKQFGIDYGFGAYHIAGSTHHVGISTHISRFKEKTIVD